MTSPSQNRGGVKVTGRKGRPLEAQSLIEPANVPTDSAEEPFFYDGIGIVACLLRTIERFSSMDIYIYIYEGFIWFY